MKIKKYLIRPGYVRSQNDGDMHYISFNDLVHLYGVQRDECIVIHPNGSCYLNAYHTKEQVDEMLILVPRSDGNYTLPGKNK